MSLSKRFVALLVALAVVSLAAPSGVMAQTVVGVTATELEALNRAFAALDDGPEASGIAFSAQELARKRLFKRLQYLS